MEEGPLANLEEETPMEKTAAGNSARGGMVARVGGALSMARGTPEGGRGVLVGHHENASLVRFCQALGYSVAHTRRRGVEGGPERDR